MFNKKSWILSFLFILLLTAGFAPAAGAEDVAAIIAESNNLYNSVLAGFKSTCNSSVRDYSIGGSDDEGLAIVRKVRAQSPKLIFAIGNKATQLLSKNVSDIPILFSLVPNLGQSGLLGTNICGISLNVDIGLQLQALKNISPSVKKVGVIYNPDTNFNTIKAAQDEARGLGLEIISEEARSTAEVSDAINSLGGRIDAFWMIIDPLVSNMDVLKRLLLFTLSEKIPLMVPTQSFVERGGLLAVTIDYSNVGKQAGEIANQLLSGAKTPGSIGVQAPSGTGLAINLKTANTIGLSIPPSIIVRATKTYSE